MKNKHTWTDLKALATLKNLPYVQYEDQTNQYKVWIEDGNNLHFTYIQKDSGADQTDFENNYKADANQADQPRSYDGKTFVRAESRPLDMTTCFTNRGDSATMIGGGARFIWNSATDSSTDNGDGTKTITVDFGFKDEICIKEGAIYFFDAPFGSEIQLWSYVPAAFSPTQADMFIDNFVVGHYMYGDCPMGDELNTEAASTKIPNYIRHQLRIILPTAEATCKGYISLEIYRSQTV